MARHEFMGVCENGHRSYLRLDVGFDPDGEKKGVCTSCGQPAELTLLDPPDPSLIHQLSQ